jgi:hypothetical protein
MEAEPTCVTLLTLIIFQSTANIQHCRGVSNEALTSAMATRVKGNNRTMRGHVERT